MYNHLLYFLYWIINVAVLYSSKFVFAQNIVLGNYRFTPLEAAIYSGFWVTFFVWVAWDFAIARGLKFESKLVTFGYFTIINIFAFWVVSRIALYMGFGITHYFWVLPLAVVAFLLQRITYRLVVGKKA